MLRKRFSRTGFTLIELLVVVSIIGVLIAILIPSLAHAKRIAKRVACLSNLRQVAIASRTYAGGNDDDLPGMVGEATSAYNYSNLSWNIVTTSATNPVWYGPGQLYGTGYLTKPNVMLCPAQKSPDFDGSEWKLPFGKVSGVTYRPSYNYQPYHTGGKVAYPKITQYTNDVILSNDLIQNDTELAHVGDGGTPIWNVVFADGHAVSVKARDVYKNLEGYPNKGVGGGSSTNPTAGWQRVDEEITTLGNDARNGSTTN